MKEKEVIKDIAIQLTIDFNSDTINCTSEENLITFNNQMKISSRKQTVIVNINDCKKIIEEKNNKKIIEYIINNAKRF